MVCFLLFNVKLINFFISFCGLFFVRNKNGFWSLYLLFFILFFVVFILFIFIVFIFEFNIFIEIYFIVLGFCEIDCFIVFVDGWIIVELEIEFFFIISFLKVFCVFDSFFCVIIIICVFLLLIFF